MTRPPLTERVILDNDLPREMESTQARIAEPTGPTIMRKPLRETMYNCLESLLYVFMHLRRFA